MITRRKGLHTSIVILLLLDLVPHIARPVGDVSS